MEDCIFCKISGGKIPAHTVWEDDNSYAFLDVKPHAKGHTVVIPRKHAVTIFDLSDEKGQELLLAVKRTMEVLQKKLNPDGFNVGWNHNTSGGQVVPHLHVHVMPRYNGDGGGSQHSIIDNPQISVEEVVKLL